MMKRRLVLALGLFLCAGGAYADLESMATAHVWVDVVSNIAVRANTPQVDMGDVQTGIFSTNIEFRVDANHEDVDLACYASDLWKGDDPTNDDVAPIPLFLPAGCLIEPINANPTGGGSPVASFDPGVIHTVSGYPAYGTNSINFESSQNGHFSQEVYVSVAWNQDDPEKPQGEYSGVVKLLGMISEAEY